LVHFGVRDYDPSLGTWIEQDPAGAAGSGNNWYQFAGGNPVNRVDPSGMVYADPTHMGGGGSLADLESSGQLVEGLALEEALESAQLRAQAAAQEAAMAPQSPAAPNGPVPAAPEAAAAGEVPPPLPNAIAQAVNDINKMNQAFGAPPVGQAPPSLSTVIENLEDDGLLTGGRNAPPQPTPPAGRGQSRYGQRPAPPPKQTAPNAPPRWKLYEIQNGSQQTPTSTSVNGKSVNAILDNPPTDGRIVDFKDYNWSNPSYNKPFIQQRVTNEFQTQIQKYQTIAPNVNLQFSQQPPDWAVNAIQQAGGTYSVVPKN
jgi:uncharacterized protein RhaS with RHS repeats